MQVLLQYTLIVILNCRLNYRPPYMLVPVQILMKLMQKACYIHNSQLASSLSSSTVCGVVLVVKCGCEYYGSSVDAAGGHGSVEQINSRWRRLQRV